MSWRFRSFSGPLLRRWHRGVAMARAGRIREGGLSNDLLDNVGHPSADHLIERFQHPGERPFGALASLFLNEHGDFAMMRKMLLTLKQRAEAHPQ